MARVAGVDLPRNKRVEIAFQYIYGVGKTRAKLLMTECGFEPSMRTDALTDDHLAKIRAVIERNFKVEGDLRREVGLSIKRLMDLGCYRGTRHKKGLPVRGQSTRHNARTRKGPRKTIANKKKVV
jgi:small subunit ribosomal protein S13